MNVHASRDNLLAGAVFTLFGGAFAYTASTYEVGSLLSMGPGYFPLVLGLILAALGVVIMASGLLARRREEVAAPAPAGDRAPTPAEDRAPTPAEDRPTASEDQTGTEVEERGSVPWARGGLLLLAILFFGVTVDGLGLGPTLFVTVLLAALAGHGTSWRAATVISLGLTLLSIVIFVMVLQLRLPLIGSWLGG